MGILDVDSGCAFKDLYDGLVSTDLEHLTASLRAVGQCEGDNLVVRGELGELNGGGGMRVCICACIRKQSVDSWLYYSLINVIIVDVGCSP